MSEPTRRITSNADAFRRLVEKRITTEQYLNTVRSRAKELREQAPQAARRVERRRASA